MAVSTPGAVRCVGPTWVMQRSSGPCDQPAPRERITASRDEVIDLREGSGGTGAELRLRMKAWHD